MNELIMSLFKNFKVNNKSIPVKYLDYKGHGEPYVTFMESDADNSYAGDDRVLAYVSYYDFDVYSKGNYDAIIESIKEILINNGFVFQPSRISEDMYEVETGYYHKTLCFAIPKEV